MYVLREKNFTVHIRLYGITSIVHNLKLDNWVVSYT